LDQQVKDKFVHQGHKGLMWYEYSILYISAMILIK